MATLEERYRSKYPGSVQLYDEGQSLFAGGMTHQERFVRPFPIYMNHADGPFKYDVDGNEIVDFVMGHGSLLMGHNPPAVAEAVRDQLLKGTHLGGASTHELRYARAVKDLMPSVDRVRFTNSGTESTYLAIRLARAFTGKDKILKFRGQFHGWHD